MILQENDLEFNFSTAVNAAKFDDCDHELSHCMKAIDFIVELDEHFLFIEVKDPSHPASHETNVTKFREKLTNEELRKELTVKFRDSFVYRWAENCLNKPIHYLILITLEEPLLVPFQDSIRTNLPVKGPQKWAQEIMESCHVLTMDAWNRNYPQWPVRRISSGGAEA